MLNHLGCRSPLSSSMGVWVPLEVMSGVDTCMGTGQVSRCSGIGSGYFTVRAGTCQTIKVRTPGGLQERSNHLLLSKIVYAKRTILEEEKASISSSAIKIKSRHLGSKFC